MPVAASHWSMAMTPQLLGTMLLAAALSGCERAPNDVPRPSDPQHTTPKPKALPETRQPDGLPASQPSQ